MTLHEDFNQRLSEDYPLSLLVDLGTLDEPVMVLDPLVPVKPSPFLTVIPETPFLCWPRTPDQGSTSQNEEVRIGFQVVCVDIYPVEWGSVNPDLQGRYLKAQKPFICFLWHSFFSLSMCVGVWALLSSLVFQFIVCQLLFEKLNLLEF